MPSSAPTYRQPWIHSPFVDLTFICLPVFLALAAVIAFPILRDPSFEMPLALYVLVVLGLDVCHVYSTLYRTYFDSDEFRAHRRLYLGIPALWIVSGLSIFHYANDLFWVVVTYAAVFHFVRQQYGFFMIYAREDRGLSKAWRYLERAAIYSATIYPLLYWHTHTKSFTWFFEGDFFRFTLSPLWERVAFVLYILIGVAYWGRQLQIWWRTGGFNVPKNSIALGTYLAWYTGIVALNSGVSFALLNMVLHGVPYVALIWVYAHRKVERERKPWLIFGLPARTVFSAAGLPLFLGLLALFGYCEEAAWSALYTQAEAPLYSWVWTILPRLENETAIGFWLTVLLTPQMTHYLLDGFIWRLRKPGASKWRVYVLKEGT